jgi:hypothetical protein
LYVYGAKVQLSFLFFLKRNMTNIDLIVSSGLRQQDLPPGEQCLHCVRDTTGFPYPVARIVLSYSQEFCCCLTDIQIRVYEYEPLPYPTPKFLPMKMGWVYQAKGEFREVRTTFNSLVIHNVYQMIAHTHQDSKGFNTVAIITWDSPRQMEIWDCFHQVLLGAFVLKDEQTKPSALWFHEPYSQTIWYASGKNTIDKWLYSYSGQKTEHSQPSDWFFSNAYDRLYKSATSNFTFRQEFEHFHESFSLGESVASSFYYPCISKTTSKKKKGWFHRQLIEADCLLGCDNSFVIYHRGYGYVWKLN